MGSIRAVRIHREGDNIQLIVGDKLTLDAPYQAILEIAAQLTGMARLIEEEKERERIVYDQAILNRSGVKIGLIHNKHLQNEAMSEAQYNRDLRRYIPHSIGSGEIVPPPVVKHGNN